MNHPIAGPKFGREREETAETVKVPLPGEGRCGPSTARGIPALRASIATAKFLRASGGGKNAADVPPTRVRHSGLDEPVARPSAPAGYKLKEITQSGKGRVVGDNPARN